MKNIFNTNGVRSLLALSILTVFNTANADIDLTKISKDALVKAPETVECTLENGDSAECIKLVVKALPDNLKIGPFCPEAVDGEGGIWQWDGDKSGLYSINKEFLVMLSEQGYKFYDDNGKISITDVRTTRPPEGNSCLSASLDESVEMTVLLPKNPVKAEKPTNLSTVAKVGLALDGVPIFADAPSVLQTGHMPALDVCGGHVDPGGWYHWHATTSDINTVFTAHNVDASCKLEQKPDALFAYAFDGYQIFGSVDIDGTIPTDLDECGGHVGPTPDNPEGVYHYHSTTSFPNLPGCLAGVSAKNNYSTTAKQGIGAARGPGGGAPGGGHRQGVPPGFDDAAKKLGITSEVFMSAIKNNGGRHLDTAAAAKELGISEADLKSVMPPPPPRG